MTKRVAFEDLDTIEKNHPMCRFMFLFQRHPIVNMYVFIELERGLSLYMHRHRSEESQLCTNIVNTQTH